MSWYLVWLFWTGDEPPRCVLIPTTSQTACNETRTGIKFPPGGPSTSFAVGGGASAASLSTAAFCISGLPEQIKADCWKEPVSVPDTP